MAKHRGMLERWLAHYCVPMPEDDVMSDLGYVADNIAAAFLFKTQSKVCYIDNVAGDPDSIVEARNAALEEVLRKLELDAFNEGFKLITVLAKLPRMTARLERLGYRRHGDYSLYFRVPGEN